MKWITRQNANVDRIACPWLIKRFFDQDAEFLYVPADQVMAVAAREGATPYDVKNVELGHVDGRCTRMTSSASTKPASAMGTPSSKAVVKPAVRALLIRVWVGRPPAR